MRLQLLPNLRRRSRVTEEKAKRQREAILSAASRHLRLSGYEAMTLHAIAADAGVTKPTLYKHFASKEDLGVELLVRSFAKAREHLTSEASRMTPIAALAAMIDWSIDQKFALRQEMDFTCAMALFCHPSVQSAELSFTTSFADLFTKAQRGGSLQSNVPPMLVAQAFSSILKDGSFARRAIDIEEMKCGIVQLLLGTNAPPATED